MDLEKLKKEIPYKWRVQSVKEWGANFVAYIDARDVQDLFDEVCGQTGWQVEYKEHKGNLFASIGIFDTESMGWVWKSDCGTESQVEKQKGEASDAFKRAAVAWGVGRFLYRLDIIKTDAIRDGNKFVPAYQGKKIWDINKHCNMLMSEHLPPLKDDGLKFLVEKGTKEQIQEALNTRAVTNIQKAALIVTKQFNS
jgi:hypothetical protein